MCGEKYNKLSCNVYNFYYRLYSKLWPTEFNLIFKMFKFEQKENFVVVCNFTYYFWNIHQTLQLHFAFFQFPYWFGIHTLPTSKLFIFKTCLYRNFIFVCYHTNDLVGSCRSLKYIFYNSIITSKQNENTICRMNLWWKMYYFFILLKQYSIQYFEESNIKKHLLGFNNMKLYRYFLIRFS